MFAKKSTNEGTDQANVEWACCFARRRVWLRGACLRTLNASAVGRTNDLNRRQEQSGVSQTTSADSLLPFNGTGCDPLACRPALLGAACVSGPVPQKFPSASRLVSARRLEQGCFPDIKPRSRPERGPGSSIGSSDRHKQPDGRGHRASAVGRSDPVPSIAMRRGLSFRFHRCPLPAGRHLTA
jgi:hypothetical protein